MSETIPASADDNEAPSADQPTFDSLLDRARDIADRILAPNATATDRAPLVPIDYFRRLAGVGLLGLTTPRQFEGHGAPGPVIREYTEILSAACGVTTFTQGQHLSACALITGGENEELKRTVLPAYARGERLIGVSFAHLRRPGPPTMRAEPRDDGYVLNGVAPWFTGSGIFHDVVLGGTLPDGRLIYTVVALDSGGALSASPPMALCAMNASGTVSLTARNLRVGPDRVMKTITAAQMAANDLGAILVVGPQIFGTTVAAIHIIRRLSEFRGDEIAGAAADALESELAANRARVETWRDQTDAPGYKKSALRIRAACISMGVRAAHAAVTATGGAANSLANDAQRLFREAMFYTLIAQTRDVQTTTLERLTVDALRAAETAPPEFATI